MSAGDAWITAFVVAWALVLLASAGAVAWFTWHIAREETRGIARDPALMATLRESLADPRSGRVYTHAEARARLLGGGREETWTC